MSRVPARSLSRCDDRARLASSTLRRATPGGSWIDLSHRALLLVLTSVLDAYKDTCMTSSAIQCTEVFHAAVCLWSGCGYEGTSAAQPTHSRFMSALYSSKQSGLTFCITRINECDARVAKRTLGVVSMPVVGDIAAHLIAFECSSRVLDPQHTRRVQARPLIRTLLR